MVLLKFVHVRNRKNVASNLLAGNYVPSNLLMSETEKNFLSAIFIAKNVKIQIFYKHFVPKKYLDFKQKNIAQMAPYLHCYICYDAFDWSIIYIVIFLHCYDDFDWSLIYIVIFVTMILIGPLFILLYFYIVTMILIGPLFILLYLLR